MRVNLELFFLPSNLQASRITKDGPFTIENEVFL